MAPWIGFFVHSCVSVCVYLCASGLRQLHALNDLKQCKEKLTLPTCTAFGGQLTQGVQLLGIDTRRERFLFQEGLIPIINIKYYKLAASFVLGPGQPQAGERPME